MSAQVAPTVPPRPTRTQQAAGAQGVAKLPDVPPRPLPKRLDRSVSPANYPRSPLNEPWSGNLARQRSNEAAAGETLPRRPSVQHLPSVGQEGMEYADIADMQTGDEQQPPPPPPPAALGADAAAQTRNIGQDLQLHAPKPSLPKSTANAQVQAVTRIDSDGLPSPGLGKPPTPGYDEGEALHSVRTKTSRNSFSRPGSAAFNDRRRSQDYGEEQGPAELGLRVPINPLLGDVQAPSPAPFSPSNTGDNTLKRKPHHNRTRSGREIFTPPGSYGLHGHGLPPETKFEKDWYAKHPEVAAHEETHGHGVYESIGSGRGSFALSSDDLNKIVRDTARSGSGLGTSTTISSYPDEQIGYSATEIYMSRSQQNTPNYLSKTMTNTSQPNVESPLRKASFPADDMRPAEIRRGKSHSISNKSDDALDSENDHDLHIPVPQRRFNKITGGEETMYETDDVRAFEDGDYVNEHGYSAPILAADEVAKEQGHEHLHPAVSPKQDRRGSMQEFDYGSGAVTPTSRPSSRPSSVYGMHGAPPSTLVRFTSHHDERESTHTPLEDVEEYEPLFPEDDDKKKTQGQFDRFKRRPDALKQRFPSQDIWEDTPSSAMYSATVSTPDLPATKDESSKPSKTLETAQSEVVPKGEPSEQLEAARFAPHLRDEMTSRPNMVPRFPSSDIWEDSPDSSQLVTTVNSPPIEESRTDAPAKPKIPPRPSGKGKLGEVIPGEKPSIPARPAKHQVPPAGAQLSGTTQPRESSPTELKKVPSIPGRPKPQIPARPAKKLSSESEAKSPEKDVATSAKVKPQVPARPGQGGKISNLRGNFMSDLNAKLGLGPPKEKEKAPEPVEDTKPLEDARKSRARGPQRRAPNRAAASAPKPSFGFSITHSLWSIDETDELTIASREEKAPPKQAFSITTTIDDAPDAPAVSEKKAAAVSEETPADAPLSATVAAVDHAESKAEAEAAERPDDAPPAAAPALAANTAGEPADPTPEGLSEEQPNALSQKTTNEENGLSKRTTVSSDLASGPELQRENPEDEDDAIPASKQTTASLEDVGSPLEKTDTREPGTVDEELAKEKVAA